jgi:hypothetical protein
MQKMLTISGACLLAILPFTPSLASTCVGSCGTLGADGDVPAPPSGTTYQYVSSNGGISGAGQIAGIGGANGSEFISDSFFASAGDPLAFFFNYITADGTSSFPDYGFAELQSGAGASLGYLFTARTIVNPGDTSPGFGLPANISTLTPATSPILGGLTNWSPLGDSSGDCFGGVGAGCGSTGWIQSVYNVTSDGTYKVRFGVTNFGDTDVDSGLAFAGLTVAGEPVVPAVPEASTWAMMILGFGAAGVAMRRRQRVNVTYAVAY